MSAKPLKGITVIDLSRLIPGPFASLILADMGATVIKVEDKSRGDDLKSFSEPLYHAFSRGKRLLRLDLKDKKDLAALLKLIRKADVLLESYRPGVLARMGLARLNKINPKLIVASVTGYGQKGPHSSKAGHDLNYLSLAGLVRPPHLPSIQWADLVGGGLWAALAIVSSLATRGKRGRHLDISMTDSMLFTGMIPSFLSQFGASFDILHGALGRYQIYQTADGMFVSLAALEDKFWRRFCDLVGKPAWKEGVYPDGAPFLQQALKDLFLKKTRQEWMEWANAQDICLTPVLGPNEVFESPHFQNRKFFVRKKVDGKPVYFPKIPVRF